MDTFKTDPERVKTVLNLSLQICANLCVLCEPFLPFTAKKMKEILNISDISLKWEDAGNSTLLKAGHKLNDPELLFDKIEDKDIEFQTNKLMQTKENNEAKAAVSTPAKANINFDDFSKLDLRVGTILEAEKVSKTKKLLKLIVDTGLDKRTVVSGIAEYYKPEDIIGKKVSILVNLEPREIKGIESKGMILMAENEKGELVFVSPEKNIENGSTIK